MQGSLINYWASEDGFSSVHKSDGQPIKPLRPFTVKMPLDDDPVNLLSNVFAFHSFAPCSPFSRYLAAGQLRETAPGQRQGTQSDEDVPAHKVAHQRGDQGGVQRRLINCAATPSEEEPNQYPRQQQDDEDD